MPFEIHAEDADPYGPVSEVEYFLDEADLSPEEEVVKEFFQINTDGSIQLLRPLIEFPFQEGENNDTVYLPIMAKDNPNGDPTDPNDQQLTETIRMKLKKVVNFPPTFLDDERDVTVTFKGKFRETRPKQWS